LKFKLYSIAMVLAVLCSGCTFVNLNLFVDKSKPLREFTLSGESSEKILIIPIDGVISNQDEFSLLTEDPGMVESVVAQLKLAEQDDDVKGILLKIDSPGGMTTASDILYNELMKFKIKTKKPVVVSMLDLAASGGYMLALPGDLITAHPTTVTGSVGVIFMRPQFSGLMDKIGLEMDITKSGKNKDMGSPFRKSTEEENKLFQEVIDKLNYRFISQVQNHRKLTPENIELVKTARIFIAEDALKIGLIDKICYLEDAISEAKKIARIPNNARVVIYRRIKYPNDNIYNTSTSEYGGGKNFSLIDTGLPELKGTSQSGFYAIWPGALGED